MNPNARNRLRQLVPGFLRSWNMRRFLPRTPPLLDFLPAPVGGGPRALLCYKQSSFSLPTGDPRRANFSHERLGPAIASAIHALGYGVDVVDYLHPEPRVERPYGLFLGHMNINYTRIARQLPAGVPRVYFASTLPSPVNNRNERGRLADLRRRRGALLADERRLFFDERPAYQSADAIICLGNETSRQAYRRYAPTFALRNAADAEPRDVPAAKDFSAARRHFLFYSGPGNVHKGLDLLLEVFPALAAEGLHLHVCQQIDPAFARIYARELQQAPNIHVHGHVQARSAEYYAIVDQCGYLVSPSCAEGSQGAVVEGLHQGLVPILSAESTVDPGPGGVLLPDCSLAAITEVIRRGAAAAPEALGDHARRCQELARRAYTEAAFVAGFRNALNEILASRDARPPAHAA